MDAEPVSTAADPCFVFGIELDGNGGGTSYDGHAPATRQSWLHIDYSRPGAQQRLEAQGLEPMVIETLIRPDARPRTTGVSSGLLVVLRGINLNPGADPSDMVSLRMWIEPHRLISVRQRKLRAAQMTHEALLEGNGPKDVPELVIEIIDRIADRIADFVDDIEEKVLIYEGQEEQADARTARRELSTLRRQTAVVRRFVAPLRESLEGLARQSDTMFDADWTYSIRDQADRITRAVEDLDLVRERLSVVQEELLNRLSQEQNDRLYVFSVVAAVFLPISFMTGLFGMNTAGLPGLEEPHAFWLVAAAMLVVTACTLLYLRSKNWF
jgi:zinc transporter